jgi:hypothetical protein
MSGTYSLDEIARTTDEIIVRRRFDRRNRLWLIAFLIGYGFFVFIGLVTQRHRDSVFEVLLGTANLALVAAGLMLVRDSYRGARATAAGRWIANHISATLITYLLVQYAMLLTLTRANMNWVPWAISLPWTLIALRMPVAELALLHAFFAGGAAVMPMLAPAPFKKDVIGFYVAIGVQNAFALALELFGSYRLRRQVSREWTERRTSAREQIRMRDELRYARKIQLSMLPQRAPDLDWLELAAASLPATEVGGDYYDYFVDGDRVALVCGDVAGHGMASGLVLAGLRSGFTLLRDSLGDPAAVLQRLHDLVAQTSRRRMLVTVTVVLLDRGKQRATVASAGHPPVILRRANGTVEAINLYAPPLGVRLPVTIPQRQLDIAPGDTFVLHSDGIYETLNAAGDSYGLDRLAAVIRDHDGPAESLRDAIVADVDRFRGSRLPEDDVTVVVARLSYTAQAES